MKRMQPDARREYIIEQAIKLADSFDGDYREINKTTLSGFCGLTRGAITHYFSTNEQLRESVVKKAVDDKHVSILRFVIINKHPLSETINQSLRRKVIRSI